jgi:alpha-tubulin suppressor-like RCC1 family protein
LSDVTKVAAGWQHTCAVPGDGSVVCWGANSSGQRGDLSQTASGLPVTVSGVADATALSAGAFHTCALLSDGSVSCWGTLLAGPADTLEPVLPMGVAGVAGATAITSGAQHACALLEDGRVSCWGSNSYGQLGTGHYPFSTTPVAVRWM